MSSFALVTEGVTDQIALEAILCGHFSSNDLEVNSLQPLRDATDESRQAGYGGWELVLEYCTQYEHLVEALSFNDYLIVQIDTDVAEQKNFNVPLTESGKQKPVDQLVAEVCGVIKGKLGDKFLKQFGERVFFAVSVHSLECWLLPLHVNEKKKQKKLLHCETVLAKALASANVAYKKEADCYRNLSKGYEKKKNIELVAQQNRSFEIFLASLPVLTELQELG